MKGAGRLVLLTALLLATAVGTNAGERREPARAGAQVLAWSWEDAEDIGDLFGRPPLPLDLPAGPAGFGRSLEKRFALLPGHSVHQPAPRWLGQLLDPGDGERGELESGEGDAAYWHALIPLGITVAVGTATWLLFTVRSR